MTRFLAGKIFTKKKNRKRKNSSEDLELKATNNEDKLVETMREMILDKQKQTGIHQYDKAKTFGLYPNRKPKTFKL
jgi:hypothetical protein